MTIQGRDYGWSAERGLDPEAVLAIQPWIVRSAQPFRQKAKALHIEMDDLIQAGNVGALRAARTFDPAFGRTFLSWATHKIKDELHALCRRPFEFSLSQDDWGEGDQVADAETELRHARNHHAVLTAQILGKLPSRDKALLIKYYGLHTGRPCTVATIAARHGRSSSAVSQGLARAHLKARRAAFGAKNGQTIETASFAAGADGTDGDRRES